MGRRYARDKRDLPHPKPVEKIELSESNVKQRLIAAAVVLVIGAAALAYAVTKLLTPDTGWQTIEVSSSAGATCGNEFVFVYELGAGGTSPTAENRTITTLYTSACRKLFQLFHTVESFEGITNLRDVSLHPNETLTVEPELYRAFETVQRYGDRTVYLGPVYARFDDLFYCTDDSQLIDFDPYLSDEVREEYAAIAAFARDPQAIDLRLLGEGRVCLYVSEDYLAYARREGVECFLDFGWLKNALIADELGAVMEANGFTRGAISSYDGFIRNLDGRDAGYSLNIYDYVDGFAYPAGVMEYHGPMSIAYLRDYPMSSLDDERLYLLKNGEVRSRYLDPADGLCRSAARDLVFCSREYGCAETALRAAAAYVADTLDVPKLKTLAEAGIQSIRCEDRVIRCTGQPLTLTNLYEGNGVRYTVSQD